MEETLTITAYHIGDPRFGRVVLKNQDDYFWNGSGWTKNLSKAEVFSDILKTTDVLRKIYIEHYGADRARHFVAPVKFLLFGAAEINWLEYAQWISKAMIFTGNNKHGFGPTETSISLGQIHCKELREIENE